MPVLESKSKVIVCLILCLGFGRLVFAQEVLQVLTENWPPYNYEESGALKGLGTEVVRATLRNANIKHSIRLGVWKGVYERVLKEPDVLIYTIARTPARENLFEWIGPISRGDNALFKLESRTDISIDKLEDAKNYLVGAQEKDAVVEDLLRLGFSPEAGNLQLFQKRILAYRMLFAGRVDLVTGQELTLRYQLALDNLVSDRVEKVMVVVVGRDNYMAFKKGSDPKLVARVRAGFDQLKSSGEYDYIYSKYR